MGLPRPVAGLAGDTQLGHMGVKDLLFRIWHWAATGCMAPNAYRVPLLGPLLCIRITDESIVAQDPAFLGNQPGEWEPNLPVAMTVREPEHPEVTRPGNHLDRE